MRKSLPLGMTFTRLELRALATPFTSRVHWTIRLDDQLMRAYRRAQEKIERAAWRLLNTKEKP